MLYIKNGALLMLSNDDIQRIVMVPCDCHTPVFIVEC